MKRSVRKAIFWTHLAIGLVAGLIIAVIAFTGSMMSFQPQILEWAERPRAGGEAAPRLSVDELLARAHAFHPDQAAAIVFRADTPGLARVSNREGGILVDTATGVVQPLPGQRWRGFFALMLDLHRALGATAENRRVGQAITGVACAGFLFLALSGLYLWWPARWTLRAVRPGLWFRRGLRGKAREWNWHNTIGFWSLPVLIVVTAAGLTLSYRWAGNLVYRLAGETPPATPAPPPVEVPPPPAGARPLPLQAMLDAAKRTVPGWQTITLRLRDPRERREQGRERRERGGGRTGAIVASVKERGAWPLFASVQLSIDPFTSQVLRRAGFAEGSPGRRARFWLRFLHTGEALGWPGQLAVGVTALSATVLIWTGFALACRRLLRRRRKVVVAADAAA
jgi:uncharacterized iron-regulated membrane protein